LKVIKKVKSRKSEVYPQADPVAQLLHLMGIASRFPDALASLAMTRLRTEFT